MAGAATNVSTGQISHVVPQEAAPIAGEICDFLMVSQF
jgi:hypothetical protein